MTTERRLMGLAAAQVLLGMGAAASAYLGLSPTPDASRYLLVPFFASALCQAFLLAFWWVAAEVRLRWRVLGLIAGAAWLEAMFPPSLRREFFGTASVAIAVSIASLLIARMVGVRFARMAEVGGPGMPADEGLRFSVRGIMAFTVAVAVLCAGVRALKSTPHSFGLLVVVWACCFVALGLVSL